jgi:hypothetical protein
MLSRLVAAALLLVAGGPLAAQEPPKQPARPDPQSTYEPRSGPGAGQAFLARFVGDWDVAKSFYPRGGGEPARSTGECRQAMIHGGRFLQSEFTFGKGADATTGTGVIGFEPSTGRFTSVWVDSRSTRMSIRQSREKFDGEQIILHAASPDGPVARPSRTVTNLEDGGRRIVHRQYIAASDGAERLVMELILTRRADARPAGK